MKSIIKKLLVATFFTTPYIAMGGFQDASRPADTVVKALTFSDRSMVILEGFIKKRVNKNTFLFSDKTGKIKLSIDDYVWQGMIITPQDQIRIEGEIDKHKGSPVEIEVFKLRKLH